MSIFLEEESQLLDGLVDGFWEHEEDKDNLESDKYTVAGEVFPARLLHTDGIDKGVEEQSSPGKPLEHRSASGTDSIGEELGEIGVSESVERHVVAGLIQKDQSDYQA